MYNAFDQQIEALGRKDRQCKDFADGSLQISYALTTVYILRSHYSTFKL